MGVPLGTEVRRAVISVWRHLDFHVDHPPHTPLEAFQLTEELIEADFSIDEMGMEFAGPQAYAAHLLGNHFWEFWWD